MNNFEKNNMLERLDQLIRLKATGNAKQISEKLHISERTVYYLIEKLKDNGCPIYYDKYLDSYCYKFKGKLIIKCEFKLLDKESLKTIKGGYIKNLKKNIILQKICSRSTYLCNAKQNWTKNVL